MPAYAITTTTGDLFAVGRADTMPTNLPDGRTAVPITDGEAELLATGAGRWDPVALAVHRAGPLPAPTPGLRTIALTTDLRS